MIAANRMLGLVAMFIAVVCALPVAAHAEDGACIDGVIGGGYVTSSVSGGRALFAMAAGHLTPTSPLGGFFSVSDSKAGFKIKSLTVDDYGGYHCAGFDPNGGPCYDRWFTGQAQVVLNKTTTTRSYFIETIITPSLTAPDYIVWTPAGCTDLDNCPLRLQVVSRGLMAIWNPDMATPGCQ